MAATSQRYNPLLISERVEPNAVGQFDLCRAASLLMGVDAATNGEFTTYANGRKWGKAKIANALKKMRNATGVAGRGSFNQSHMDDFLTGIGFPINSYTRFNRSFKAIKETLDTHVVFLAGDVKHTPAGSPLRKYVNPGVGHEIILVRINKARDKIAFIDPMTPHGTKRYLRWAPASHFRQFGSEFSQNGDYVAGTMRKGAFTQERKTARQLGGLNLELQRTLELRDSRIEALETQKKALKAELAALEVQPEDPDLVEANERIEVMLDLLQQINVLSTPSWEK